MHEYIERIRSSDFVRVESYKIIQGGWSNIVIEVNDGWIFRFAREKNPQVAVEYDFLSQFGKYSPISIPSLKRRGEDYIVYKKIVGERFAPDKFELFSNAQKNQLIIDLGKFLTELHNFQFSHQYLFEFPHGGNDFWEDLWPVVKNRLSDKAKYHAENYFNCTPEKINRIPFDTTVTHADLGTNNILVDFKRKQLGGIIDFSDLCIGDPAVDFAGFYRHFGRQFVENLLRYYGRPVEDNFWTRIDYESKRKLFYVVYYALNHGFESHIPSLVESIEKIFLCSSEDSC